MNNKNDVKWYGLGFADTLTIVFIILKLLGVINWAWLWVLSPMWISIVLGFIIFLITFIILSRR